MPISKEKVEPLIYTGMRGDIAYTITLCFMHGCWIEFFEPQINDISILNERDQSDAKSPDEVINSLKRHHFTDITKIEPTIKEISQT